MEEKKKSVSELISNGGFKQIISKLSQRPIAVFPIYIEIAKCHTSAIFLAQCVYYSQAMKGEFYKTNQSWMDEFLFSERELRKAKSDTKDYVEIIKKGNPAQNYYDVKWDKLIEAMAHYSFKMEILEDFSHVQNVSTSGIQNVSTSHDNAVSTHITENTEITKKKTGTVSELVEFIEFWNTVHNTKYRPIPSLESNFKEALGSYSLDEMKEACKKIKLSSFWYGKMTPTIFFRKRNPEGQPVDYVGQFLSLSTLGKDEFYA